jgi:hypothetical protein
VGLDAGNDRFSFSAVWGDYDGDGRLDIYAGQMWSDNGVRVTASPAFMPEAGVHALSRKRRDGARWLRRRPGPSIAQLSRDRPG